MKSLFNLVKVEVQFTYAEIFSVYVLFKGLHVKYKRRFLKGDVNVDKNAPKNLVKT